MAFRNEEQRSRPFTHVGHNGVTLRAARVDLAGGYLLERPRRLTDEQFASDVAEIFCWYWANIVPELNGFTLAQCKVVHKVE